MDLTSLSLDDDRLHNQHDHNPFYYPININLLLRVHHLLGPLECGMTEKSQWFPVDSFAVRWRIALLNLISVTSS